MTNYERFAKTIKFELPDRIPAGEIERAEPRMQDFLERYERGEIKL